MTQIADTRELENELLAGLEGVTDGPWQVFEVNHRGPGKQIHVGPGSRSVAHIQTWGTDEPRASNAAHLARCSPDNIRALLSTIAELRETVAEAGWSRAASDVLAERRRQVEAEGWTPEHDDQHSGGELATAAAWYAINAESHDYHDMVGVADRQNSLYNHFADEYSWCRWPWAREWWKPKGRRRDLIRAAALLLAEIERIDRLPQPPATAKHGGSNAE